MPTGQPEEAFRRFIKSTGGIGEITRSFALLCKELSTTQDQSGENNEKANGCKSHRMGITRCEELCGGLNISEAKTLVQCLTARSSHVEYEQGTACRNSRVLVVGAGPCGLRMAIECALLGAESVDVIEKRPYLSRNNVLHLWSFVVDDLRRIGAKVFHSTFGCGAFTHISTKTLQEILLKIALLLGVEVHAPVEFKSIVDPDPKTGRGWRVNFGGKVMNQRLTNQEFDVMIAAAGAKCNVFPGFTRKRSKAAKKAIAVSANFVNNSTTAENDVKETGGLEYIYDREFFNNIKETVNIDLENIVYYKDDTHYFVMTPKKSCLLAKGVLRQDHKDSASLLSKENIDLVKLKSFACDVAKAATNNKLPVASLKFAKNHLNEDDVAAFDFTELYKADHACRVSEKHGRRLLLGIVGDFLLEPFWPTGSGIAKGFLGVLDTAWLVRNWSIGKCEPTELIAERETIFKLLSQATPGNLNKNLSKYTINPITRYDPSLCVISAEQVKQATRFYDCDQFDDIDGATCELQQNGTEVDFNAKTLLLWFQNQLSIFADIFQVVDLHESWRNALALCALVQLYRPDSINVRGLDEKNVVSNAQLAFELIKREFHVVPIISAADLTSEGAMDSLNMITYLFNIYLTVKDGVNPSVEGHARIEDNVDLAAMESEATINSHVPLDQNTDPSDDMTTCGVNNEEDKVDEESKVNELKDAVSTLMILADELHDIRAEEDEIDTQARVLGETIRSSRLADSNELVSQWLAALATRFDLRTRKSRIMFQISKLKVPKDRHSNFSTGAM